MEKIRLSKQEIKYLVENILKLKSEKNRKKILFLKNEIERDVRKLSKEDNSSIDHLHGISRMKQLADHIKEMNVLM